MIDRRHVYLDNLYVKGEISSFVLPGKVEEFHVMLHAEPRGDSFESQLGRIRQAERLLFEESPLKGGAMVFKRCFISDAANQHSLVPKEDTSAVSVIQQPVLDGSKIAVWIYAVKGASVCSLSGATLVEHNGYRHIYKMGIADSNGDSYSQTNSVMDTYGRLLSEFNADIASNCIRTWFYVRDVDTQYQGMVKARKEKFAGMGLTEKTHYIASTGIGGVPSVPNAIVQLDAYALTGFNSLQQNYLYAYSHLSPTHDYGVTFERGTYIEYGDRKHLFISGTASIDNRGDVVHPGDVAKQTFRMWENVEKLLEEGGSGFEDIMQIIVYLRDMGDYATVRKMFEERFSCVPAVYTLAPVCRTGWLVEMECIAISRNGNPQFRDF